MTAGKRFKRLVRERARRTGESYMAARRALANGSEGRMEGAEMVEVELEAVRARSEGDEMRWLAFKERDGQRRLMVCIGHHEAASIAFALQGVPTTRPMTHDALSQVVEAMGGRLSRIVIGHLPATSTFTADVTVALPDDEERHFDRGIPPTGASRRLAIRTTGPLGRPGRCRRR